MSASEQRREAGGAMSAPPEIGGSVQRAVARRIFVAPHGGPESLSGIGERVQLQQRERLDFCYKCGALDPPFLIQPIQTTAVLDVRRDFVTPEQARPIKVAVLHVEDRGQLGERELGAQARPR